MTEICNECGKSVKFTHGKFVNRVRDFNTPEKRKAMGKPYPEGDYVCGLCDMKRDCPEGVYFENQE